MTTLIDLLNLTVNLAVLSLLGYVAWFDFWNLKIRNQSILALIVLYLVWASFTGFQTLGADVGVGVLLFAIGFVMWFARMMGAGDVKLYFCLGLFMGFSHLAWFAILLLLLSLLFMGAMVLVRRSSATQGMLGRLKEIGKTRRVPYAVPMCGAAMPIIMTRFFTAS